MPGIRWTSHDRYGNPIYLTQERWEHIIKPSNHPEMEDYEEELKEAIREGNRKQDALNLQKYRYSMAFKVLPEDNTHVVAIILFRFRRQGSHIVANNYIVTAYQKEVR